MADTTVETLRQHNADYGVDGSFHTASPRAQVAFWTTVGTALAVATVAEIATGRWKVAAAAGSIEASLIATAALYLHATRRGKFAAWAQVLDELDLTGDETLLDLGCGRGAVLLAAAKLLPRGRAIGVDLWRADQTGNSPEVTRANAATEGVADRVEIHTADITNLPFGDDSVDVIVSSLVIHNIPGREGRERAVAQAARVLRPGGRLAIADLAFTGQYARQLRDLGWTDVRRRSLGWRMWFGPFLATRLVTATKPR